MRKLNENEKSDELVKSLLESGFEEGVIAGWIDNGSVSLEKSEDPDPEEESKKKKGEKTDEDPDPEEESKKKKGEKTDEDPDPEEESEEEKISKSITDSIMKSISGELDDKFVENKDEILKSIPAIVESAISPLVDKIEKSLDGMRKAIVAFSEQAPNFKSAGIAKAFLAKSIEEGKGNDAEGRKILSVSRNRGEVRDLIEKSIEEEADETLRKSISEGTQSYMIDALYGEISEDAARYFYEKKNVRLVR